MRWNFDWRIRGAVIVGMVLVAVTLVSVFSGSQQVRALGRQTNAFPTRNAISAKDGPVASHGAGRPFSSKPQKLLLTRAHSAVFDVRKLKSIVIKRERPEHEGTGPIEKADAASLHADMPSTLAQDQMVKKSAPTAPRFAAPAPSITFDGLDFANWGAGHPPDTNGDVGPTYYIQTVNTSIGIYNKSNGSRVAAFTFNSFMSQGAFGNLCDTDNFGDPVVLYDTYEDRWFISDFAFKVDANGNVTPQTVYQCFAVSKTGDPVNGGWNFYSILDAGGLGDYPKFGIWPDGIYMSANMFDYAASGSFQNTRVWALNKQQMYAGAPSVSVVSFNAPSAEFTILPANSRIQEGAPPVGTANPFAVVWQYLNQVSIYKFHVDWDKISTSTFTGPFASTDTFWWEQYSDTNGQVPTPGNKNDTLYPRLMVQNQYSNIGGVESVWLSHTVGAGNPTSSLSSAQAAVRYYQVNVTGGTVGANTTQSFTYSPDTTLHRYMPSVAVDRLGDMAIGYTTSNATTNPALKYAGRLAGDAANSITQTEQTLFQGTGAQSGLCGGATCTRWGDYSAMTVDPDGCNFWYTNEYYNSPNSLNDLTRIGEFKLNPSCTAVGNGTLSGTVTDGTNPISGATVTLGSRTTTTDASGNYSFSVPAGTYWSLTAAKAGYGTGSASTLAVPSGGTKTQNFTLSAASQSGCITDNSQTLFQQGVPTNCDLTTTPGSIQLSQNPAALDQSSSDASTSGNGYTNTTYVGQTFTPATTGKLTSLDVELFCSSCTGTTQPQTVTVRTTSGGLPTTTILATGSIAAFNSGAGANYSVTFATPPTLTAGTVYAFEVHAAGTISAGTYAVVRTSSNLYAGGQSVLSSNSGSTWGTFTGQAKDLEFHTYIQPTGFISSGTFVSSLKDANPATGNTANWTTLSWTATTPASTTVKFQVAGSNSQNGPFNFVGPDGTASTFFTTSGASLSQFNGFRYIKYEAFLSTSNSANTPSISSVQTCFSDVAASAATTLTPATASGTYGGTTTLTATLTSGGNGVSGKTVSFTLNGTSVGGATTNASGVATLSNVSLSGINAGSYPTGVAASFAGDASYLTSSGTSSLTVSQASQAIVITTHAPSSAAFNSQFTVAATGGGSGNAVTFGSSGSCTNSGATFTITVSSGTCTVTYNQAGNTNYSAAPQLTETVNGTKANQTITITTHAPASAVYGTGFTVAATGGGSGNAVTFGSSGGCTNSGATFTMTSGTTACTVTYDQAGNTNYNAATQQTESVTAQKASQTITVTTHAPASAAYNSQFTVAANAPGGAVSFSNSGVCSNAGATYTMTSGTGTCTVLYNRAGDSNYNAAPQVSESVTASKINQSITFLTPADRTYGDPDFDPGATASSGFAVSYSASGNCSIVSGLVHITGAGSCTVTASQSGDANYNAAPQVQRSFAINKADQAITVSTHAPASAVYATGFSVAATGGGSGNSVTFGSSGGCTNAAASFSMTSGTTDCTVTYDQAGNANYNAAPQVTETVTAQKATQAIAIGNSAPASAVYGTGFTVAATGGGSGNAIVYGSSGVCSNSGADFTMTSGTGTCTVTYDQAGDANYNAAPQRTESVTAQKANQTITVTTNAPASAVYNTSFGVAASAPGGAVSFSSSGVCSNTGATFTMTSGTGTCTVLYNRAADANYNAAPQVSESVTAQKASQAIAIGTDAPASAVYGAGFTVAATGGGSGNAIVYGSSGVCSNSGAAFTMTSGTGTCTVTYNQAGNENYSAAPQQSETVTAQKAGQTVGFGVGSSADHTYGDADFDPGASSSSGNPVSYAASGTCVIIGGSSAPLVTRWSSVWESLTPLVHITGAGSCTVTASQSGDANYDTAQAQETFSVAKAALSITAGNQQKLYLQPLTLGTSAFISFGLVGSDSVSGVTLTSAGAAVDAASGDYAIVASQAVSGPNTDLAGNYTIAYHPGTLHVGEVGIVGLNGVTVKMPDGSIDSFDSSAGAYGPTNHGSAALMMSNGPMSLGGVIFSGSLISTQGSVVVGQSASVSGDVTAGTTATIVGPVGGAVLQQSPSTALSAPTVSACSPYSGRGGFSGTGTYSYSVTTGNLTVKSGRVNLARGTYCFHQVSLWPGAKLVVSGAVTVHLTGKLLVTRGYLINTTNVPSKFTITSSFTGSGGVVIYGISKEQYVTIVAPGTDVSVTDGAYFGTLVGGTLNLGGALSFHADTH